MSLDATRWAWQQTVTPAQKLLLLSLADRANDSHHCYPSIQRLEQDTGLNRKTIMKAISEMEEAGILSVQRALGKGNFYLLQGVRGREDHPKPVPKRGPVPKTTPVPKTGLHQSQNRDYHQYQNRDTNLPIEPINNLKEKVPKRKISFENLPPGISSECAEAFIEHRKLLKAPLTQRAFDLAMTEAAKAKTVGITPDQAIDETISAGWKGIKIQWVKDRIQDNATHSACNRQGKFNASEAIARDYESTFDSDHSAFSGDGEHVRPDMDKEVFNREDINLRQTDLGEWSM